MNWSLYFLYIPLHTDDLGGLKMEKIVRKSISAQVVIIQEYTILFPDCNLLGKNYKQKKKPLILAFEANILSNSLFLDYLVIPSRKTQNIIWGNFFLKITNFLLSWYNISIEIACIKTSLLKIMQGPKPFTILGYNNPPNILAYERAKKL